MTQLQLFDATPVHAAPHNATLPVSASHGGIVGAPYLGFTPDTTPAEARALYCQKYGVAPARVFQTIGGLVLAGPVGGAP